jgi:hypothetical protein
MEGTSSCYDSTTGQVYGSISGSGCTTCWSTEEDEEIIEEAAEVPSCGYHHCGETFDVFEAYELGWQNFGQAWNIYWNPNATYGQRFVAGAYMSYWGGAHVCLVICTGVAVIEYLVPGAVSCMVMIRCAEAVYWSGGQAARTAAETYANVNGKFTLEMTAPGRILDLVGKVVPYQNLKPFWDFASRQFARGTSGDVNVFIHIPKFNPEGTWATVELLALKANPNVTSIFRNLVP